ncbi:hypothetical protein B0H15DRAFT_158797 [Mycena belliarum]|uniref:Uncharacterized protein n=1 Tax=Mycena belliarum TaxID=1033014 RepID=A0AAD6TX80_9AGAR|nr:hypothetical protein B0H15DRAFT_517799 [Mycena belliae]KAJ7093446.1 hypothetical protein B0H15DRAFT_158797 [Mycena belliae]
MHGHVRMEWDVRLERRARLYRSLRRTAVVDIEGKRGRRRGRVRTRPKGARNDRSRTSPACRPCAQLRRQLFLSTCQWWMTLRRDSMTDCLGMKPITNQYGSDHPVLPRTSNLTRVYRARLSRLPTSNPLGVRARNGSYWNLKPRRVQLQSIEVFCSYNDLESSCPPDAPLY